MTGPSRASGLPDAEQAVALARLVKPNEHWRLYPDLKSGARFVDIETVGLAPEDAITLVGIADECSTTVLVRRRDLTLRRLAEAFEGASVLVTFNGVAFDLPRLRRAFPGLACWDLPHLDLALLGRQVGLSGGLKAIERTLGLRRPQALDGVDGAEAVRLWNAHCRGDRSALPRLMRYCRADAETLVELADLIYGRLRQQHPVDSAEVWLPRIERKGAG